MSFVEHCHNDYVMAPKAAAVSVVSGEMAAGSACLFPQPVGLELGLKLRKGIKLLTLLYASLLKYITDQSEYR